MTVTEELRRMLDERGVEWENRDGFNDWKTKWEHGRTRSLYTENKHSGFTVLEAYTLTPEQAIAATLGRWTCEIETTESWLPAERYHRCKHCGAFFAVLDASGDIPPCVCPNCGKAVKR